MSSLARHFRYSPIAKKEDRPAFGSGFFAGRNKPMRKAHFVLQGRRRRQEFVAASSRNT